MFALFDELEEQHLRRYQAEHSANWGDHLREELKHWATLRTELAKRLMTAHGQLVEVLREAPTGTVADPASIARELLASAFPAGYEEQHLRRYLSEHTSNWGDHLRNEVRAWAELRIELAVSNAREMVDILKHQAPPPLAAQPTVGPAALARDSSPSTSSARKPTRPQKPVRDNKPRTTPKPNRVYLATVVHINPHGAVVSLDTGKDGWLHISQLRVLNGGQRVASVGDHLKIGQQLRTRGIGVTKRGQVQLALVSQAPTGTHNDVPEPLTESTNTSASQPGRGFFRRLLAGRSAGEHP